MSEPKFTYDGDPSASDRDAVRFHIGDTNKARPLLDDREVDFAIAEKTNLLLAGAFLADHLSARFSSKADTKVGPVSKSLGKIAEAYAKKATQLRIEAGKGAGVSFPAIQTSTKRVLELNTDLPNPSIRVGQFDDPNSTQFDDIQERDELGNP